MPVSGASSTRALDLDDLDLAAGALEVVVRRSASTWSRSASCPSRRSASAAGSSPATVAKTIVQRPEAEVEQLVDAALALLGQHVLARDAEIGGARLDVGGDVATAAS